MSSLLFYAACDDGEYRQVVGTMFGRYCPHVAANLLSASVALVPLISFGVGGIGF